MVLTATKLEQQETALADLQAEHDEIGPKVDELNARAYAARENEILNAPTQGASAISSSAQIHKQIADLERRRSNLRRELEIRRDLVARERESRFAGDAAKRVSDARTVFEAQHARGLELVEGLRGWWDAYSEAVEAYGQVVPEGEQPEYVWADLRALSSVLWSSRRPELGRLSACAQRSDDSRPRGFGS